MLTRPPKPKRTATPLPQPTLFRFPLDRPGDRVERRREPTGRLDVVVGLARQEAAPAGLAVDLALVPHHLAARQRHGGPADHVPALIRRVVGVVVQDALGDPYLLLGVPDHAVGVGADRDGALLRVDAEQPGARK